MSGHIGYVVAMLRRSLLTGMTAILASRALSSPARGADGAAWSAWKARFLSPDGRIIDSLQGGVSHSEGQGYGLLLAQAQGDRVAFEAIEAWTRSNLLVRDDPLMAWRWRPGVGVDGSDWHTATDGDLFRAWALHRAAVFSTWDGHDATAAGIAHALAAICLAPDPRAGNEPVLLPSAETPAIPGQLLFNPSYIMPRALQELGQAHGATDLIRAADHGETLLGELAEGGLVPDWALLTPDGFAMPGDRSANAGYDAIRVPLYLAWSGRWSHPAVRQTQRLYRRHAPTPVVATRDGRELEASDDRGYRALRNLLLCEEAPPGTPSDEPYYPATLGLLADVARRENGTC